MSSVPAVTPAERFDELFHDPVYLKFKEHLFSYLRRRDAILEALPQEQGVVVEIGAGTCPVTTGGAGIIHSDVSEQAMRTLKAEGRRSQLSVFSAGEISLATECIDTVICSEVLEHIDDDQGALAEIARILRCGGTAILTVPVHSYYFASDDIFVGHRRRYSVSAFVDRLRQLGFSDFTVVKVSGPLEKLATLVTVRVYQVLSKRQSRAHRSIHNFLPAFKLANRLFVTLIKWESKLLPLSLTTIVLIRCRKFSEQSS